MIYCEVNRIENSGGTLTRTRIGYLTASTDADTVLVNELKPFTDWIESNISDLVSEVIDVVSYFDSNPDAYEIGWKTNNIDGLSLPTITDINDLDSY